MTVTKMDDILRIYQQYFMVSNAARLIIDECIAKGSNLYDFARLCSNPDQRHTSNHGHTGVDPSACSGKG